jgi:hypothetical protein
MEIRREQELLAASQQIQRSQIQQGVDDAGRRDEGDGQEGPSTLLAA